MDMTPIRTPKDALESIDKLILDLTQNPDKWENNNLKSYLESIHAMIQDLFLDKDRKMNWDEFIKILESAQFYE
jgi:hypothetical protein